MKPVNDEPVGLSWPRGTPSAQRKPSRENEERRVSFFSFKLTIAWWRLLHMPVKNFNQKWVDPHSQP